MNLQFHAYTITCIVEIASGQRHLGVVAATYETNSENSKFANKAVDRVKPSPWKTVRAEY